MNQAMEQNLSINEESKKEYRNLKGNNQEEDIISVGEDERAARILLPGLASKNEHLGGNRIANRNQQQ